MPQIVLDSRALCESLAWDARVPGRGNAFSFWTTNTALGAAVWRSYAVNGRYAVGGTPSPKIAPAVWARTRGRFLIRLLVGRVTRNLGRRAVRALPLPTCVTGTPGVDFVVWTARWGTATAGTRLAVSLVSPPTPTSPLGVVVRTTTRRTTVETSLGLTLAGSAASATDVVAEVDADPRARFLIQGTVEDPAPGPAGPGSGVLAVPESCVPYLLDPSATTCQTCVPSLPVDRRPNSTCTSSPTRAVRRTSTAPQHTAAVDWATMSSRPGGVQEVLCHFADYCLSLDPAARLPSPAVWGTSSNSPSYRNYERALPDCLASVPPPRRPAVWDVRAPGSLLRAL